MYYIPRTIVSLDKILNEDTESRFDSAFQIEMYIQSIDGYEGDGIFMSKFGLQIRNQLKIAVSKRQWNSMIGKWNKSYNSYRPAEGDLVYIPSVQGLFEIKFVNLEDPFHQLNNLPIYKMTLELFEYRGEDMDTGIESVDEIQNEVSTDSSYRTVISYLSTSATTLEIHEPVTITWPSSAESTARVTAFLPQADGSLVIQLSALRSTDSKVHILTPGAVVVGQKSGAQATITKVITLTDGDEDLNDDDISIQNTPIEKAADDVLTFSEQNPFGEPNDAN
jgi:hypothetical protein